MEDMAATTTMATGVGAVDLMANATFVTRPATCGEIASDCLMDGPLLKAKREEEQGEEEAEVVEAVPADMMTKRLVEQQHWKCCKLAGMALN
ncbi:hypothetical protein CLOP_g1435 [Closterium sp. NIES-67]|nr:hypothetical protein CLOP_g1435 [Closterium sp. NIES-67]